MKISDKFANRILKLKTLEPLGVCSYNSRLENILTEDWPGTYTDIFYESEMQGYEHRINIAYVVVFETAVDATAFKLKYGNIYV